ncbi:MAG: bifunctional riboflavin kinase/FMN adenylyltransferase, partial [Solirubrobacterales bacterium]
LRVLHPEASPKLIMPFSIKRDAIASMSVQELVVIPFDAEFSQRTAEDFCSSILIEGLTAEHVAVGENFRFGARAVGTPEMLAGRSEFETSTVPLVELDGETVTSSRIRALIAAGEVEQSALLLDAPFTLEGKVVSGDQRGRELGFPTANLIPDDALVAPGHGVYAALADGAPAAVNVGVRPTFDTGRGLLVEAYLLDFEGDLYGQTLRIEFVSRLRGERRFDTAEELVEQMHLDVEEARKRCASFSNPPLADAKRATT